MKNRISTICAISSLFFLGSVADATTWHVDASQTTTSPAPDGTSWATAFNFLQDALTAAQVDDLIKVAQGTYYPDDDDDIPSSTHTPGNRDASFIMKHRVVVEGGYKGIVGISSGTEDDHDPDVFVTILSGDIDHNDNPALPLDQPATAQNSKTVVNGGINTNQFAILNGVTIRDGHGGTFSDLTDVTSGAGVFVPADSSPTFTNCHITRNWVSSNDQGFNVREGGGMFLDGASTSQIQNCRFIDNEANKGGAFACHFDSDPTFQGCQFEDNVASNVGGGAVFIKFDCDIEVRDCTFVNNSAPNQFQGDVSAISGGGAALVCLDSTALFRGCNFEGNSAFDGEGGAIRNDVTTPITVVDCLFQGNSSILGPTFIYGGRGGAVFVEGQPGLQSRFINCVFQSNAANAGNEDGDGGAICAIAMTVTSESLRTLANCLFVGNEAGYGGAMAMFLGSTEIANSTFSQNVAQEDGGGLHSYNLSNESVVVRNSIIWDNLDSGSFIQRSFRVFRG